MKQSINSRNSLRVFSKRISNSDKRKLSPDDVKLFFSIINSLEAFIGEECGVFKQIARARKRVSFNEVRKQVHDYWSSNPGVIDQFIKAKKDLSQEQKDIVLSWKRAIAGRFICAKIYSECALFILSNGESDTTYYAVRALTDDFEDLVQMKAPFVMITTLLPFKDIIVWNGLVMPYDVVFGKNMAASLKQEADVCYKEGAYICQLL